MPGEWHMTKRKYSVLVLHFFTSIVFVARKEFLTSLCRTKAGYTLAVTDIVK
jgi:hypothetical protein